MAINKTKVVVVLNKEVDTVTAENFAIEGGNVTAASLAEDKKTVTLSVSGLAYDTEYTLVTKDIVVDGVAADFGSKTFTTPTISDLWELQISTNDEYLIADGADNTEVTFKLIDKVTGEVDTAADNVVLDLNTTYGTLASKRVTVQDGVATVLLTSEFSNTDITAKIDAQIIEASGDYKDLINHVFGTVYVPFKTTTTENVDTLTLVSAEANQADRITLFFDKDVTLKHFVKTNTKGELLYTIYDGSGNVVGDDYTAKYFENNDVAPELIEHTLIDQSNIKIAQANNKGFKVKGLKPVTGNSKAIEVILDKTTVLKDNAEVKVDVVTVNSIKKETPSSATFIVTDARKPEATSVAPEGLNKLKVKFSESIADAIFQIDGRFKGVKKGESTANAAFTYEFGEFNPVTLVDNRDLATIELVRGTGGTSAGAGYDEDGIVDNDPDNKTLSGYFSAGKHTLQVSSTKDFAFATDPNNLGSTQNLNFTIAADSAKPNATVTVESPEQFRLKFDKALTLVDGDALKALITSGDIQLQYLDKDGEYKDVNDRTSGQGKVDKSNDYHVEQVSPSEYVIELTKDWTRIYDTDSTNKNYYNDKFRLYIKKDAVTSLTNGLKNDEIKLDLNYAGSPLNSPDTTSPVINSIERVSPTSSNFHVTMSEPVKLKNSGETETLAQGQGALQETTVQFIGKDKDGATVTINGKVLGYADKNHADRVLNVTWATQADGTPNTVTPQTVVNDGGSEYWTVVIRSISDDVGNTAASATKEFKVAKEESVDTPFFIDYTGSGNNKAYKVVGKGNGAAEDTIEITFSEGVQYSGTSDATNPAFYTLNGQNLPNGTSISIADDSTATHASKDGFEKVIISLPDGTLNAGAGVSNVITVNKNLVSYDGSKLEGETEITFTVPTGVEGSSAITTDGVAPTITPAVEASGTITFGTPTDGDKVTVGTTTFTYQSTVTDSDAEFSNINELTSLIDGLADVTATNNGTVVTVKAATAGTDGNTIALTSESFTVSGSGTLENGANAVTTDPGNKQVVTLTLDTVADASGKIIVTFTDGTNVDAREVQVAAGETKAMIANKIAQAFSTGLTGWTAALDGETVTFTADVEAANNTDVKVTIN